VTTATVRQYCTVVYRLTDRCPSSEAAEHDVISCNMMSVIRHLQALLAPAASCLLLESLVVTVCRHHEISSVRNQKKLAKLLHGSNHDLNENIFNNYCILQLFSDLGLCLVKLVKLFVLLPLRWIKMNINMQMSTCIFRLSTHRLVAAGCRGFGPVKQFFKIKSCRQLLHCSETEHWVKQQLMVYLYLRIDFQSCWQVFNNCLIRVTVLYF